VTPGDDLVPPPPRERRVVHAQDGTRLNVEVFGPDGAPTVVLSHGWTLGIAVWARQLNALAGDLRVVAYDQRGHGASDVAGPAGHTIEALADDLAAVLLATVPAGSRAVVAGHSMGGMSLIALGGRQPDVLRDRVAAALLVSTGMHELVVRSRVVPMPLPLARLARPLGRRLMALPPPPGRVDGRLLAMTRYVTLARSATHAEVDFSARVITACPTPTRIAFARMLSTLDIDADVARFDVPAIVLAGDRDRLTPIWHARRMAAVLPRSHGLVTVPGAGHMTPVEAPRAVNDALRRLVRDHLRPPAAAGAPAGAPAAANPATNPSTNAGTNAARNEESVR
jgi:pimeloyl-ACP methyl ester carboxylesterase